MGSDCCHAGTGHETGTRKTGPDIAGAERVRVGLTCRDIQRESFGVRKACRTRGYQMSDRSFIDCVGVYLPY